MASFDRWLRRSALRFDHPPRVVREDDMHGTFTFIGLDPLLEVLVGESGIGIWARVDGEMWDWVADFELQVHEDSEGGWVYMIGDTTPSQRYSSLETLFIEQCFEPFLRWCKKSLIDEAQIRLYTYNDCTWVRLAESEDASDREADWLVSTRSLLLSAPTARRRQSPTT